MIADNKEFLKAKRKDILTRHGFHKMLMIIYCKELCSIGEEYKFYKDKVYPCEWYYIDKNWYYHKLEIACRITAEGQQSCVILDTVCDPAYAYKELSSSVYWGLDQNWDLGLCEQQLKACFGKPVRKRGKHEF